MSVVVRIVKKILDNGLLWSINRVSNEFKFPTFRYTKVFRKIICSIRRFITYGYALKNTDSEKLVAIYDLRVCAITYDFAFFVASAESFMRQNKKNTFVIYIVTINDFSVGDSSYKKVVNSDKVKWGLENIILPLISRYPTCSGYSVLQHNDIEILLNGCLTYPSMYDGRCYIPGLDYKHAFNLLNTYGFTGFCASKQGISYVNLWLKERGYYANKVVTITIRSYAYDESRNSNINDWIRFSGWLEEIGYIPIFILDTNTSFLLDDRFDNCVIFKEVCWNIGLRVALYEVAYLNYVSAGPASVAQLNKKARYISMNLIIDGSLQANKDVFETYGLQVEKDKRYAFAGKHQILSFKKDIFENMVKEFEYFKNI